MPTVALYGDKSFCAAEMELEKERERCDDALWWWWRGVAGSLPLFPLGSAHH
jgi:hypothetical protein